MQILLSIEYINLILTRSINFTNLQNNKRHNIVRGSIILIIYIHTIYIYIYLSLFQCSCINDNGEGFRKKHILIAREF